MLPDGSGTLMGFYNGKDTYQPLSLKVYGDNDAVCAEEKIYDTESVYLPYFGIKNGTDGLLAELCDGAAVATINAYTGSSLQPASTYVSYSLYDTAQSSYLTEDTESYTIIPNKRYKGNIALRYTFLSEQQADYNQMASICRQRIFGDGKSVVSTITPVLVQAIGCVEKEDSLLGLSYKQEVALTTFAQAKSMMEYFKTQGISNMSLQFQGGFSGGYYQKFVAGDNKPLKRLGGDEEFRLLASRMNELDIAFYPDFDVQYVYQTGFADGFSAKRDAATLVNRSKGYVYTYNFATFQKENNIYAHILNLTGIKKSFSGVARFLDEMNLSAVSLRRVGQALNADYNAESTEDRQVTLDETVLQVEKLARKNIQILTEGANAPYLKYLNACTNLPLASSGYAMTDQDVPFLQMVLNGNIDNYSSPLNAEGDFQEALLKNAITATGIQLRLVACSVDELKDIELTDLFAADYDYYRTKYASAVKDYQTRMSDVVGQKMISYQLLTNGVHYSEFANGKAVIVNMTEQPYVWKDGLTIGAKSFEVTEVLK